MRKPFEIGDRVAAYSTEDRATGVIENICSEGSVKVRTVYGEVFYHSKQLRRLVKPKRREWWILERRLEAAARYGRALRPTPPDDLRNWVHVREVLPRKVKP